MQTQNISSAALPTPVRNELAGIRSELAKALQAVEPDAHALYTVLQRLDTLIAPVTHSTHAAQPTDTVGRAVGKSLFAGW